MHVFGRGGRFNQIAVTARSCNEKHENNSGKTFTNTLEYNDQKFHGEEIIIWSSGKIGRSHAEVGVQNPTVYGVSVFLFVACPFYFDRIEKRLKKIELVSKLIRSCGKWFHTPFFSTNRISPISFSIFRCLFQSFIFPICSFIS